MKTFHLLLSFTTTATIVQVASCFTLSQKLSPTITFHSLLPSETLSIQRQQQHGLKYAKEMDIMLPNSLVHDNVSDNHNHNHNDNDNDNYSDNVTKRVKKGQTQKSRRKTKQTQKAKQLSKQEILWNTRYDELLQFHKTNNHSNVPYNHSNRQLSRWVTNQRQNKKLKKRTMDPQRISKLDQLDFAWETRCTWETRFDELKEFSLMYGHCNVPPSTNLELSRFVTSQRRQYKLYKDANGNNTNDNNEIEDSSNTSTMTKKRLEGLISIGFDFDNNHNSNESTWMAKYNQLKQYQQTHNHCAIPPNYNNKDKNLRRWIDTQRTGFRLLQKGEKKSPLTQRRLELLDEINFIWDPIDAKFYERVKELKEFYELNDGPCVVTLSMNPSLYSWIKNQFDQYQNFTTGEKSSLTQERIDALQNVGLVLDCQVISRNLKQQQQQQQKQQRRIRMPWIEKYNQLEKYASENGHCIVPQKHPHLGTFVKAQRNHYRLMKAGKKSSMTQERIDKLNSIDFVWNVSENKQHLPLREIAVHRAVMQTLNKKKHSNTDVSHLNSEMLLEHYQRKSLWG